MRARSKPPRSARSEESEGARKRPSSIDRTSTQELEQAALRYLNRYDASVAQLRGVLLRHAKRHGQPQDLEDIRGRIDGLLNRYQASRLLDDARYADNMVRGLRERGSSAARIRLKLRQRGVTDVVIDEALARFGQQPDADERVAARAYAQRKRLRSRYDLDDPAQRQKALAALARQGFSYAVAQSALLPEDDC